MPPMKTVSALSILLFIAAAPTALHAQGEEWHALFDGESLAGWEANESPDSWAIVDGAIVAQGKRSHLFYAGPVANASFKNFEFVAEVKTKPGSNSGIYIHTTFQDEGWPAAGYECQVVNSTKPSLNPLAYVERKMTGSIYAVRNTWAAPVKDDQWFEYRIVVSGKTIRTYIDGALICEYTEPNDPWRPDDKKERLLSRGTFALQAHDPDSVVAFRGLKVKLLPDDAAPLGEALADSELDRLVTKFSNDNVALIDVGIRPRSKSADSAAASDARRYGLTLLPGAAPDDVLVVTDRDGPPSVEALRAAQAKGEKLVFSSGDVTKIEEARIKQRLQAMEAAELGWRALWTP